MINISELITDPDFCQPNGIKIERSTVTIVNHRPVSKKARLTIQGIITVDSENEDELLDESDRNKESIHVFSHERLKTVGVDKISGKSYDADVVIFNGARYIVRYCLDDAQYGFCRSTAIKMEQDVM